MIVFKKNQKQRIGILNASTLIITLFYSLSYCDEEFNIRGFERIPSNLDDLDNERPSVILYHFLQSKKTKMISNYIQLGESLGRSLPNIRLYEVDCKSNHHYCTEHEIEKYPSLQVMYRNKTEVYDGPIVYKDVYLFIKKEITRSSIQIQNSLDLEEVIQKHIKMKKFILLYIGKEEDTRLKLFHRFCKISQIDCFHTFEERIRNSITISTGYFYLITPKRKVIELTEKPSIKHLKNFVNQALYPGLVIDETELRTKIFGNESPAIVVFVKTAKKNVLETMNKIARKYKDQSIVVAVFEHGNTKRGLWSFFKKSLGFKTENLPILRYIISDHLSLKKYKFRSKDISFDRIVTFVDSILNGKGKPYYLSEKIRKRKKNPTVTVRKVVGNQLISDLLKRNIKGHRVYLYIHGSLERSRFFRKMNMKFLYAAKSIKLKKHNLEFWRMNGELNEIPDLHIEKIPIILEIPGGQDFKTPGWDYFEHTHIKSIKDKELGTKKDKIISMIEERRVITEPIESDL